MNYEVVVPIGNNKIKVFMQNGFIGRCEAKIPPNNILHNHSFAELHTVYNGSATLIVNEQSHVLESGDIAFVPRGQYHVVITHSEEVLHRAFQVDLPNPEFERSSVAPEILGDFAKEADLAFENGNVLGLSTYFALLISRFMHTFVYKTQKVSDYSFLINEFFAMNYKDDLRLSDLAEILCVSEKQAERLVVKYTGKTFVQMLTTVRIDAAKQLMMIYPSMPLSSIAQSVGYRSYSGFWKAYKRFEQKEETTE